jgi:hypothetical protein
MHLRIANNHPQREGVRFQGSFYKSLVLVYFSTQFDDTINMTAPLQQSGTDRGKEGPLVEGPLWA